MDKICQDGCKGGCKDAYYVKIIGIALISIWITVSGYFFNAIENQQTQIDASKLDTQIRLTKIETELVQSKAILYEIKDRVYKNNKP